MASNLSDLMYGIGHSHPGGVVALATRLDKGATVLQHKFNPNNSTHFLNPVEIEMTADLCNANDKLADFFAAKAGKLLIDLVVVDGSDLSLLDGFLGVMKEMGDFSTEFQTAYSDHKIDAKEFKAIAREGRDVMAKMAGLLHRIEQVVED